MIKKTLLILCIVLSFAIQTAFSDRPNINGNEEKIQPHLYPTMKLNPTELVRMYPCSPFGWPWNPLKPFKP